MSRPLPPPPRDFDLDPAPRLAPRAPGGEELYVRLVANPFLACAVVLLTALLVRTIGRLGASGGMRWLATAIVLVAAIPLTLASLRYHCLDCGAGGRLTRWRAHLCPSVAERRLLGQPRRLRGPTPGIQLLIALWAIALAGTLVLSGIGSR